MTSCSVSRGTPALSLLFCALAVVIVGCSTPAVSSSKRGAGQSSKNSKSSKASDDSDSESTSNDYNDSDDEFGGGDFGHTAEGTYPMSCQALKNVGGMSLIVEHLGGGKVEVGLLYAEVKWAKASAICSEMCGSGYRLPTEEEMIALYDNLDRGMTSGSADLANGKEAITTDSKFWIEKSASGDLQFVGLFDGAFRPGDHKPIAERAVADEYKVLCTK